MSNQEVITLLNDMKREMEKSRSDMKIEIQTGIAANFQTEMQPVVSKINTMEKKIDTNSTGISRLEREKREMNIIIYNLEENNEETWEILQQKVLELLETVLGIACKGEDLARVKRIGMNKTSGKIRPVLIRFLRYNTKIAVLKNKSKLKGLRIKIDEDYPPEVQERRKILWPELKRLREDGHVAYLMYDKIVRKDTGRITQKRGLSESPEGHTQNRTKRSAVEISIPNDNNRTGISQPLITQQQLQNSQRMNPQYQQVEQSYMTQQLAQFSHQNGPQPSDVTAGAAGAAGGAAITPSDYVMDAA